MRDIHQWFGSYAADHQNPVNRAIHWVCVPVIMWAVIAALWTAPPVLPNWFRPGLWAVIAMFAAFLFYRRLSRNLGYAMAVVFIASGAIAWALYGVLGPRGLLILAAVLFVAAWIGQFVGHAIEGRRPAFFDNIVQLLIGPAWLMGKLMRRLGIAY
ncbi:MAG TPA: Mpo1-like protein [Rhodanobacteraceae bacterium]|nr:Mpo1-like protein [Rhodanobacteraceae bacterium]